MNVQFNLSKIMIFTKFHNLYYLSRSEEILGSLKGAGLNKTPTLKRASEIIFTKHDNLIDMRHLFDYLIEHVGSERIIDPLTKEDSLWSIVDLYTHDPEFYMASQLS